MLYVTTRNHQDAFTVQHVMTQNRGVDGGLYLPLHFPKLSENNLNTLRAQSFNQRIAFVLNLFFGTKLSGWDVDFSIGRYPVRLKPLSHRIILGELWHNLKWKYSYLENKLAELICCGETESGSWTPIAIRMAILAAAVLDSEDNKEDRMDIAAATGDFSAPISAWYLRKMGFPIGNIICCCAGNNQLWDLICLGQMKTDDALPVNLERLVSDCADREEVARYLSDCSEKMIYSSSDEMLQRIRKHLYVSVVSDDRVENTIPNVYKTYDSVLHSEAALAYCGLLDYRTKTGVSRPALVICDYSPSYEAEKISDWMKLSKEEFLKIL